MALLPSKPSPQKLIRSFLGEKKKPGAPPGTLVHVGSLKTTKSDLFQIIYNEKQLQEKHFSNYEEFRKNSGQADEKSVAWLNINGVHDLTLIEKIGTHFNLHPLVMEDIVDTSQRPKMEEYEDYVFIVLKVLYYKDKKEKLVSEQISLILLDNTIITFQEAETGIFNPVLERLRNTRLRIRKRGTDYLAYALVDTIIDHYFGTVDTLGDRISKLEEVLLTRPERDIVQKINRYKRIITLLRKHINPLRDMISSLMRSETSIFTEQTLVYVRDVYDHILHVTETLESHRDLVNGMMDIHLANVSNRMNEVMKVLTVMSAIFIPLTFITGIFGMNFQNMPELEKEWFYPEAFWSLILGVALLMIVFFKRKGWL